MTRKIVIGLIAVALLAVVFSVLRDRSTPTPGRLKVSGTIEVTPVVLSFKIGGRLAERTVDEGGVVKAGQIIARIEDEELKEERNSRSAEERASRAAVADMEAGSRREEISRGEAALARAKTEADRLVRDAARSEELFRREIIPLRELETARAGRDSAAASVREAEEELKLLKAGPRPDAVRQARARAEGASSGRSLADTRLSQSILTSPISGQVLSKHAEPGEMLVPGAPVLTVASMDEVWLRGYIPETELGLVRIGQTALVTFDSWAGRNFEGKVSFISPEAEFTPKNVQTQKERVKLVYRIKITLPNPKGELKPGMPADAVIAAAP